MHYERSDDMPGRVMVSPPLADDDTDEFGHLIQQHARDEQRLHHLLDSGRAAFRKGRHVPNLGVKAVQESLIHDANEIARPSSAASSTTSEPALRGSGDWGSRATYSRGWLQRGLDGDESMRARRAADATLDKPLGAAHDTPQRAASPRRQTYEARLAHDHVSGPDLIAPSVDASATGFRSNSLTSGLRSFGRRPERVRDISALSRRLGPSREPYYSEQGAEVTKPIQPRVQFAGVGSNNFGADPRHVDDKENRPLTKIDTKPALIHDDPVTEQSGAYRRRSRPNTYGALKATTQFPPQQPEAIPAPMTSPPRPRGRSRSRTSNRQSSANAPEPVVEDVEMHATPAIRHVKPLGKTPLVTGAWIDTPRPERAVSPKTEHAAHVDQSGPHELGRPSPVEVGDPSPGGHLTTAKVELPEDGYPKSALDNLVKNLRSNGNKAVPAELGDDTIASLEGLVDPTLLDKSADEDRSLSQTLDLQVIKTELDKLHAKGRPLTTADKDRAQELLAIQGMDKSIRQARLNLKDVNRGLRRVERKFDQATCNSVAKPDNDAEATSTPIGDDDCDTCGRPKSVFMAIGQEVTTLFVRDKHRPSRLPSSRSQIAITWLGAATLAALSWYLVENSLW